MSISIKSFAVPASFALATILSGEARSQSLLARLTGSLESEFGTSVAAAGDFDHDGIRDLLVGAPGDGELQVFSGATFELLLNANGGYLFGSAVLGDVDLDGDGRPEVIASRPLGGSFVRIYGGPHGALLRQLMAPSKDEEFGRTLCRGGDIDGDGTDEIVIGAPAVWAKNPNAGHIYYYSYAKNQVIRALELLDPKEWGLGLSIADVGDIDGDGMTDLAARVRSSMTSASEVRIYSGTTGLVLRTLPQPQGAWEFGASIVGLGPIAPGGHAMIAIGAPMEDANRGSVYRYDAATGALLDRFEGKALSEFGSSLESSERPGEEGSHTLFVGAPAKKSALKAPGRVFVFDAPSGTLLHELESDVVGESYGHGIASLGDLDGDDRSEFVVGAPRWNQWSGAVYVHDGVTPCGKSVDLGGGCVGSLGIQPKLAIEGCLRASSPTPLDFSISQGPHVPTLAFLFLGAFDGTLKLNPQCALNLAQIYGSPIPLPITPNGASFPLSIGSGHFAASAVLPATGYAYSFRAQAVLADPGSPFGLSTTNAVELSFEP